MRRLVTTFILLLLLGATTSVAVAWLFALDLVPSEYERVQSWEYSDKLMVSDFANAGFYAHRVRRTPAGSFSESIPDEGELPGWGSAIDDITPNSASYIEEASGWPFLCLKSTYHEAVRLGDSSGAMIDSGIRIGSVKPNSPGRPLLANDGAFYLSVMSVQWVLPTQIIWIGFVGNTFFWILPWLSLSAVLALARDLKLRRRGRKQRCRQCGYSLQLIESARCPECGWEQIRRLPITSPLVNRALVVALGILVLAHFGTATYGIAKRVGPEGIHLAALNGDIKALERALASGISIDEPVTTGDDVIRDTTPLMWATLGSQPEVIQFLLAEGADVDAVDLNGNQAIHYAAKQYSVETVRRLLEGGADIDVKGEYAQSPLNAAMLSSFSSEVIHFLIEQGADLDSVDFFSFTPLGISIRIGELDLARTLIDAGASVEVEGARIQPINWAVSRNAESVQLLIDAGCDVTRSTGDLICAAIGGPEADAVISILLEQGVTPDLNKNADSARIPIFECIQWLDLNSFRVLVEAGADLNARNAEGETILLVLEPYAGNWWEDAEWTAYLSTLDLDFDGRNLKGRTALMVHTEQGNEQAVAFLLKSGANPHLRTGSLADGKRAVDYLEDQRPGDIAFYYATRERIREMLLEAMAGDEGEEDDGGDGGG